MQKKEIIEAIKKEPGHKVSFAVADIDGVLRGKIISKSKFLKSLDDSIGFCNVIFGWDVNDRVYDNVEVTGWHTGYPDSIASVDVSTFRTIPWNDDLPFFLGDFHASDELAGICPRTLLTKIQQQCNDFGLTPLFANEFEWFNFSETPQSFKEKGFQHPAPLTPGMFGYSHLRSSRNATYFNDLYDLLRLFDVPLEGLHTETGDGVYEASIEYTNILDAADRAVCFKTGVKEIACHNEIMASFMAKWNINLPGCSSHIHQSLWDDKTDKNVFFDASRPGQISSLMEQYIAGQLYCLPHILPMYAPTVNSYKRLIPGSWAATSSSWGFDNRTTALRVINTNNSSTRLETRVPGADANPYLSMAAALASGLYGIKNELSLDTPKTTGNEYENTENKLLPASLKEATKAMRSSTISTELFGASFTNHFINTREWEWRQFTEEVTNWELKRYFEII